MGHSESSGSSGSSGFTIDPWTQSLIENGDMIKANVSNGMDRGGILVVESDNGKLRTTWKEIMQSMIAGKLVVVRWMNFADATASVTFNVLTEAGYSENDGWYISDGSFYYSAASADGAPALSQGAGGEGAGGDDGNGGGK